MVWQLTNVETNGDYQRSNDFEPDPDISEPYQVISKDYSHSGYDRGHMAPAADMKFSAQAMTECFYMSNMCPQLHNLNAHSWERVGKPAVAGPSRKVRSMWHVALYSAQKV